MVESQHRLEAIVNTARPNGIITIDGAGIIESLNPAAEQMFGYAAAEAIAATCRSNAAPLLR